MGDFFSEGWINEIAGVFPLEYVHFFESGPPLIIKLDLVPVDELILHEEVIKDYLKALIRALKTSGVISDPIIIDDISRVVLDGTHRVCALKKMHLHYIPAAIVDYMHDAIQLKRWFRILNAPEKDIVRALKNIDLERIDLHYADTCAVDKEIIVANKDSAFVVEADKDTFKKYSILRELERKLYREGVRIDYVTEDEAMKFISQGKTIIMTPKIEKHEVINYAKRNLVFPPKSTRHVFRLRPIFLNFPLKLLRGSKAAKTRKEILREFLLARIPLEIEGRITIDRFYEEDYLLLFV